MCFCGGIFKNEKLDHVGSFASFFTEGNDLFVGLNGELVPIEFAMDMKWKKFLLESNFLLVVKGFPMLIWSLGSKI